MDAVVLQAAGLAGGSLDQGKKRLAASRPYWNGHQEEKDVDIATVS